MTLLNRRIAFLVVWILPTLGLAAHAEIPTPESRLGFQPGADFKLARWEQVVDYFRDVGAATDRVSVQTLGESTQGRPFLVAVVSAPETLADLDHYRDLQHSLADPRRIPGSIDPAAVVAASKPVVLITCTIHSSETASTLMAMELLHELASKDDEETLEILDGAILLLVPSVNPDGVDLVADWYGRSLGKPWEGSGMPWLYHPYAGHDTNRDWFMLNLKETRLLSRLLYHDWFPTITYDVHQMGSTGARLFVPPFHDPVNPNLDPRMQQGIALIGTHMAADLARAGKKGVLTNAMYDNWWQGGNRTVPQRHNMVGVLTEAASVRLASPIFLTPEQLRGGSRGFAGHELAVNFVDPWPGGWWRLRDIVEYELVCARSVLTLAARYREQFQSQYTAMARDAIAAGEQQPPYGWIIPADQPDLGRAADMVEILHATGIDVHQATEPITAVGRTFPRGSWVIPAAQPFRPHVKDLLERQRYPDRLTGRGEPETPYDVAGWTLPLQMGVEAVEIAEPFMVPGQPLAAIMKPIGEIAGVEEPNTYALKNMVDDDLIALNTLLEAGIEVRIGTKDHCIDGKQFPPGTIWFEATEATSRVLGRAIEGLSSQVHATSCRLEGDDAPTTRRMDTPRIGVYQPWVPSMDEGWTRLVLENFRVPYTSLHNADIRVGGLSERFDAILIPSIDARTLREGYEPNRTEPEYVGGLGQDGSAAFREFVRDGGVVVCLEQSCQYAISEWKLPVEEVLGAKSKSEFYGPGSILNARFSTSAGSEAPWPLLQGVPEEGYLYFNQSLAFRIPDNSQARTLARYASNDVLASGWLRGEAHLADQAALVEVTVGSGRVILFGFPPQHRGQSRGTFRLLINALLGSRLNR